MIFVLVVFCLEGLFLDILDLMKFYCRDCLVGIYKNSLDDFVCILCLLGILIENIGIINSIDCFSKLFLYCFFFIYLCVKVVWGFFYVEN